MERALIFIKIAYDHGSTGFCLIIKAWPNATILQDVVLKCCQRLARPLQFSRKTEFCFLPRCYKIATFNYRIQSSQTNSHAILN